MNIDRYDFNGFSYIKDYENPDEKIKIIHNKKTPEYIFKFYALNKFSIDAITKGYFYASHPFELNDYLDSSPFLLYTSKALDFEYYEKFFGELENYKNNPKELEEFYKRDCNRENLCKGYISQYWDVMTNKFGIISTTGKENSPLMWPHYTQEKGFQIKFNTKRIEKSIENKIGTGEYLGLIPMNYSHKLSPIDISQFRTMFVPLYFFTNLKSKNWNYEDEWRFIVSKENMGVPYSKIGLVKHEDYFVKKENRYAYYDHNIVEEIALGMNFFNSREFNIEWIDDKRIKISPRKIDSNWNFDSQKDLMNYIVDHLKDKFYYSGVKYELDDNQQLFLIRTKEKLEIERIGENQFILTRTNEILKIF